MENNLEKVMREILSVLQQLTMHVGQLDMNGRDMNTILGKISESLEKIASK